MTVIGVTVHFRLCKHSAFFVSVRTRESRYPLSLRAYATTMSRGLTACIICHQLCRSFITLPVRHTQPFEHQTDETPA